MQQTAAHLRQLLLRPPYRSTWLRYQRERERHDDIHQKAVTQALSRFVDTHRGEQRYCDLSLGALPQRVSRAMRGEVLSRTTLHLFVDAFSIKDDDASRLWRLYEGTDRIRVLTPPVSPPVEMTRLSGLPRYRVKSLHEHHYVGQDGLPSRHRTQQVIRAISDPVDRYIYQFDTSALTVEVEEGGRLAGPLYRLQDEVYAVNIKLDEPLRPGEDAPLRYVTLFQYEQAPRCEFRRAARSPIEDVGIRVEFDPSKLPRMVWWAVWDGIDGEIIEREPARLRAGTYVYRRLDSIQDTVVGYTWEW